MSAPSVDRDVNVGCRALAVADEVQGVDLPVWVMHPTHAPHRSTRFGPYELDVATDAPVAGEGLPLVVISHGNTGSPWVHRGTAAHLARTGFVVAMPEHLGNSRTDSSLTGTFANLVNRPRHLRLTIDAVLGHPQVGPHIAPHAVGVVGHSIGAFTALATAGGRPLAGPHETPDRQVRAVPVVRDHRVGALALLAPAVAWYMAPGALTDVDVRILLRTGELDDITPWDEHAPIVMRGVTDPRRVDHRVVRGAGHFSFQTPFPAAMTQPGFPPSQDPMGFDRPAYAAVLNAELVRFFRP